MPDSAGRRGTVLVLDDEPLVCELVSDVAIAVGLSPRCASTMHDIAARACERYDVVVADLHLGAIDVPDVLRRVAESSPVCSLVLMTGSCETTAGTTAAWARSCGLDVVAELHKPVSRRELRRLLESLSTTAGEPVA